MFILIPSTDHKKYFLSQKLKTDWMGAYNFCRTHDMHLVSLDDGDEADNFFLILNNQHKQFDGITYIGGITTLGGSPTLWYWANSGNLVNFPLKWHKGEPNNGGILSKQELCLSVSLSKGQFGFNDYLCNTSSFFQFICQYEEEIEDSSEE
jgi:hypothetical protein